MTMSTAGEVIFNWSKVMSQIHSNSIPGGHPTLSIIFILMAKDDVILQPLLALWRFRFMSGLTRETSSSERRMHRRWTGIFLVLPFSALLLLAFTLFFPKAGIRVTIRNNGDQPIRAVTLFVTGNTYYLGDIPANGMAEATVQCTGDSHLEIDFQNNQGKRDRLNAGGYFEPGYRGVIHLSIKNGEIQENQQQIEIG